MWDLACGLSLPNFEIDDAEIILAHDINNYFYRVNC